MNTNRKAGIDFNFEISFVKMPVMTRSMVKKFEIQLIKNQLNSESDITQFTTTTASTAPEEPTIMNKKERKTTETQTETKNQKMGFFNVLHIINSLLGTIGGVYVFFQLFKLYNNKQVEERYEVTFVRTPDESLFDVLKKWITK